MSSHYPKIFNYNRLRKGTQMAAGAADAAGSHSFICDLGTLDMLLWLPNQNCVNNHKEVA
jgi:hypothetical protein